jgi:hypothetical protein
MKTTTSFKERNPQPAVSPSRKTPALRQSTSLTPLSLIFNTTFAVFAKLIIFLAKEI